MHNYPSEDLRHDGVVAVAHPEEPLLLLRPLELLAAVPHVLVGVHVNLVPEIGGVPVLVNPLQGVSFALRLTLIWIL